MNPPEAQPDFAEQPIYFDPESPDASEQEFSASLENPVKRPQFVLDAQETVAENPGKEDGGMVDCETAVQPDSARGVETALSSALTENSTASQDSASLYPKAEEGDWRDQVSAKVSRYKSRKPREERYPSLQLKFEGDRRRPEQREPNWGERDVSNTTSHYTKRVPAEDPVQPQVADHDGPSIKCPPVSFEATARVLEFPRSFALPVRRDNELADPVVDRPRIVEAPELLPPPPAMGGSLIEESRDQEYERRPGFDMPLQSASLSRRLLAGGIDVVVILLAMAGFGYVSRITGSLSQMRSVSQIRVAASLFAGIVAGLWFVYQYAFLVFSGSTPGLRAMRVAITGFDGAPPTRKLRRWRVIASLLSCLSLGLGYIWCFMDEDQLSWHDRITKTHIAPVNSPSSRG